MRNEFKCLYVEQVSLWRDRHCYIDNELDLVPQILFSEIGLHLIQCILQWLWWNALHDYNVQNGFMAESQ